MTQTARYGRLLLGRHLSLLWLETCIQANADKPDKKLALNKPFRVAEPRYQLEAR